MPILALILVLGISLASFIPAHADEPTGPSSSVDRLVEILVAKGVLDREEAVEVLGELARVPVVDMRVTGSAESKAPERYRIRGDLRLRAQTEDRTWVPDGALIAEDAGQARFRWRAGVDVPVQERWMLGFGLTSGGSAPRSTNQTFDNAFQTYDARIDYVYASYRFNDRLQLIGGKFDNPLWNAKDLLWDSDIRPEGAMVSYRFLDNDRLAIDLTSGGLILSDKESNIIEDAYMWVAQLHGRWQVNENWDLDLAPAYYFSQDLKGTSGLTENAVSSNTRDASGNLLYGYNAATLSGALTWKPPALVAQAQWFGELIHATDPSDDDLGWLAGFRIGARRLDRLWSWQFSYSYRRLEKDAWPEYLSDSDFLLGATGVKGSEFEFKLALGTNTSIGIDYYANNKLMGSDIEQDLLQLDLNLSW
jgi:hypothetical protein